MIDLAKIFSAVGGRDARSAFAVPESEREHARSSRTLAQAYREFVEPHRREASASLGLPRVSTLRKESQAIRRWERWDLEQRPSEWPVEFDWNGLPIGFVTGSYVERWITDTKAADRLSRASITSTWSHLRTVFNWLRVRSKVLEETPEPAVNPTLDRLEGDGEPIALAPATWSRAELGSIYAAVGRIDADPTFVLQLQTAFVVSTCCGPRTGDLFALRFGSSVRLDDEVPHLVYMAAKTGKWHWCPLPSCAVDHLRRVGSDGPVFSRLTAPHHAVPEHSRESRVRNAAFKSVLETDGSFDVRNPRSSFWKPWQVGRATAYTRVDDVSPGAGELLCHPPHSPKRRQSNVRANYLGWQRRLHDVVLKVEQPHEFNAFA